MSTIWKLFTGDVRRITSNIISVIILLGLVAIPPLFTWFNVTASWDPFGNTKNLKFAVANTDGGYTSDLVPVKISLGDQVVSQLRANGKLDWTFTSKSEAIEGTKSGKYYAAVVIPKNFSSSMMTLFSPHAKHAKLDYYTNEKKNAVATKVTGQGADSIAEQINQMFATTITTTALGAAKGLIREMDSKDARTGLKSFNTNVADFAGQLNDASTNMTAYGELADASTNLLASSTKLLGNVGSSAQDAAKQLKTAGKGVKDSTAALGTVSDTLNDALKASSSGFAGVGTSIDNAFASSGKVSGDTSASMRQQATTVGDQISRYQQIRNALTSLNGSSTPSGPADLTDALDALDTIIAQQTSLQGALNDGANNLDTNTANAQSQHQQIKDLAAQAKSGIDALNTNLAGTLKPQIDSLTASLAGISGTMDSGIGTLNGSIASLQTTADHAASGLKDAHTQLANAGKALSSASKRLTDFNTQLDEALNSGDMTKVRKLLSGSTNKLASALAAPVTLKRTAVYHVENFGTSLTPFYTFIPLWVGALLIALTLKTDVSKKIRRELAEERTGWHWAHVRARRMRAQMRRAGAKLRRGHNDDTAPGGADSSADTVSLPVESAGTLFDKPKPYQLFLGRFGIFALISLMQSTISCAGTLLFLRVHAVHPLLFVLSGWISGLVYAFIIYTLVACFGTIGKATAVIILVMQISGSSGSYPLQVLPKFVSVINPWLPAAHSIQAARAAIAGIYNNDYFVEMGIVLIYALVALVIGLITPKPTRLNRWFTRQTARTKLI